MRHPPEDYEGQELELVYIAARLEEAQKVEAILDEQGLDYTIQVEHYRSGVIFTSLRAGAFFYAAPDEAANCRRALAAQGRGVQS